MNNLKHIISSLFIYNNNNNNCQTLNNDTSKSNDNNHLQCDSPKLNMNTYLNKLSQLKPNISQDYITKNILFIKEKEAQLRTKKLFNNQSAENMQIQYRNKAYDSIPGKLHERRTIICDNNISPKYQSNRQSMRDSNKDKHSNLLLMNCHKDFGKTPQYLKQKIEDYNEQKEYLKKREKEKLLPKGMRLLPETERLLKLKELNDMKKDLEEELGQMPIARISMKRLLRKGEIESLLKVIDSEYAKYSLKDAIVPIINKNKQLISL